MDWNTLSCPNRCCRWYGKPLHEGLLVRNGTSHGQRQGRCRGCGQRVALSYGTASFDLHAEPAVFALAVRALAEGNSLRSTARMVQVDQDTVGDWLDRAASQGRLVVLYCWRHLHVTECQLDELWSFVPTKEQHLDLAKCCCETSGDAWVWIAFAPVWRLVVAFVVGKRTPESADLLVERVAYVTDECIPLFTSDQLPE